MLNQVFGQPEGVSYLTRIVEGTYTSPLLLLGPEGVGKRFSVLQAVKQIASKGDAESPAVFQVDNGLHPDVCVIEPEGSKDIGIDTVREVLAKATTYPMTAPYKCLVLDGVDRLTMPAANALLKTLEEPPVKTRFFLIAQTFDRVIPTIRSRCGHVRYRRLTEDFILSQVRGFVSDETKAIVYTRLAEGSLGKAIQYVGANRLTLRDRSFGLIKAGLSGDFSTIFSAVSAIGKDDLSLGILLFEHILYDLAMIPMAPDRITNQDLLDELKVIRDSLGAARVECLRRGLYDLILLSRTSSITLDFHLKSYLASVFAG